MVRTMVATPALRQAQKGTLGHLAEQVLAMHGCGSVRARGVGESGRGSR